MNNIIESYTIPRLYKLMIIPVLFGIIIASVFVFRDFQSGALSVIDFLFLIGCSWCCWMAFKTTYKVMIYPEHIRCMNLIGSIEVLKKDIISIKHGIRSYKLRHKDGKIIITSLIAGFEEFTKWVDPKSNIEIYRRIEGAIFTEPGISADAKDYGTCTGAQWKATSMLSRLLNSTFGL